MKKEIVMALALLLAFRIDHVKAATVNIGASEVLMIVGTFMIIFIALMIILLRFIAKKKTSIKSGSLTKNENL